MRYLYYRFLDALVFLSRLTPTASRHGTGSDNLVESVPFYPAVGLLLGFLAALPAMALPLSASWLAALAYAAGLAWLTRGLHWDGLADLADACGSNASGDRFWEIIKDSRIGAFGVMALVFGIAAQIIAAQACLANGNLAALVLAPAYGRAMVIPLGRATRPHPASLLAVLVRPGTESAASLAALLAVLLVSLFVLGVLPFLAAGILTLLCLTALRRLADARGGANGDFYGTAIILSEIAVLLAGGF